MLLGYIVSQRGIEPNPEKVAALDRMVPIQDLKGVQKVLGCLAALNPPSPLPPSILLFMA
jgi:hypothetical protein